MIQQNNPIMDAKNLYNNLGEYLNVIKAFKKRYDVQNGFALGYRLNQNPDGELLMKNKPHSIGEGLTTTGWCVSVSQAFLNDNAFKILLEYRGAKAKLVSIDIKEQFWGACYNGSKNTWHTAILVNDSGVNFIIDLTCAQFGNKFVEKFIWNFETWEKTFRSPICKHKIMDFDGNILTYNLTPVEKYQPEYGAVEKKRSAIEASLHKYPSLSDGDIKTLVDFFDDNMDNINCKLINGTISNKDATYTDMITEMLTNLGVSNFKTAYYNVMKFPNKTMMLRFVKLFITNGFVANHYMIFHNNMEDAIYYSIANYLDYGVEGLYDSPKTQAQLNTDIINKQDVKDDAEHFVVFEISDFIAYDTSSIIKNSVLVPFGYQFDVKKEDIFNGVQLLPASTLNTQKTNTVYIRSLKG